MSDACSSKELPLRTHCSRSGGHGTLGALERLWDELYAAEQARIQRLLIERIDVAPDGCSVTLHAAGIRSLVAELASESVAEGAILEAAE